MNNYKLSKDIETEMLAEISKNHTETLALIHEARAATEKAVRAALYVGQLISKTKHHKRSKAARWLSENIDSLTVDQCRNYVSCHSTEKKRPVTHDKRCLQLLGILPKQSAPPRVTTTKAPQSLSSKMKGFATTTSAMLDKRPVEQFSQIERELLRKDMETLAKLYVELCQKD